MGRQPRLGIWSVLALRLSESACAGTQRWCRLRHWRDRLHRGRLLGALLCRTAVVRPARLLDAPTATAASSAPTGEAESATASAPTREAESATASPTADNAPTTNYDPVDETKSAARVGSAARVVLLICASRRVRRVMAMCDSLYPQSSTRSVPPIVRCALCGRLRNQIVEFLCPSMRAIFSLKLINFF